MSLDIEIKTIPQKEQRYVTVGDYWQDGKKDIFRISDCSMWEKKGRQGALTSALARKYEWMIAIHELIEKALNEAREITNEQVDAFDESSKTLEEEPGDEPNCPYRDTHCFATAAERMLCAAMGLSWKEYDQFLGDLE